MKINLKAKILAAIRKPFRYTNNRKLYKSHPLLFKILQWTILIWTFLFELIKLIIKNVIKYVIVFIKHIPSVIKTIKNTMYWFIYSAGEYIIAETKDIKTELKDFIKFLNWLSKTIWSIIAGHSNVFLLIATIVILCNIKMYNNYMNNTEPIYEVEEESYYAPKPEISVDKNGNEVDYNEFYNWTSDAVKILSSMNYDDLGYMTDKKYEVGFAGANIIRNPLTISVYKTSNKEYKSSYWMDLWNELREQQLTYTTLSQFDLRMEVVDKKNQGKVLAWVESDGVSVVRPLGN